MRSDLSNVGQLPSALADLVENAGRQIGTLSPVVLQSEHAAWLSSQPPAHSDISIPGIGSVQGFDLSTIPSSDTPDGLYRIDIDAIGDGANYGRLSLDLNWVQDCDDLIPPSPTASPTPSAHHHAQPKFHPHTKRHTDGRACNLHAHTDPYL